MADRYLRAYYHTFDATGVDEIDAILEAVASAGKAYHHTGEWGEPVADDPEVTWWDQIQVAANKAAEHLQQRATDGE